MDEKMNMIVIGSNFKKRYLIPFNQTKADVLECFFN